ncbi:AAA family ATPase [Bacteroides sp. 519]|uniref:AAA family ATPase n=1 Tax=Bacteroides sp. 519 TaxID=2302937 RepID=UPI0013D44BD8|nr:AAA family ATPase [Bacteroides sp. 519]NDV56722.1 hypothetical protein [Bacteroides sp. 519]
MPNVFITNITVGESRNLKDFTIPLSDNEKKHLIITGKNGSGKTSLINDINRVLELYIFNGYQKYDENIERQINCKKELDRLENSPVDTVNRDKDIKIYKEAIIQTERFLSPFEKIDISFSDKKILHNALDSNNFTLALFDAKRNSVLTTPKGISKIELKKSYKSEEHANQFFIQYIVNLKAERSFARDDGDNETVKTIDNWFHFFEEKLRYIFDAPTLKLIFDRKNYNFTINEDSKIPYTLNQLSDGYSAIISIITELILRMEALNSKNYEIEGVVLIDEIETHLHVDLQKKVLPFLTSFFPKIQFIVTTHSPFILSSISDAVICDLESKIITEDLTGYSYEALIESYFNSDKYSIDLKDKLHKYELLMSKEELSDIENNEKQELRSYFTNNISKFNSDELIVKLQQIELDNINK